MISTSLNELREVPIGDFCQTGSGGTPSRSKATRYFGGSIPWVKSGELRETVITETEECITKAGLEESAAKLLPVNALLVALYGATVGRIGVLGVEAATNQAVCHIIPDARRADNKYLYYALQSKVPLWLSQRVGGGQPNISQAIIKDTKIPLPPLPEQKRIADILDKADAIRRKRQEALQIIRSSYRSLFLAMFGDPVENPRGLPTKCIGDLATRISKGESPKWQGFDYQSDGVQFITSENVRWGYVDTTSPKFISHAFHAKLERSQLAVDDLLINLVGASVGRAALVPSSQLPANVNQAVAVVSLDREVMLPSFLLHQMLNDKVQRVLLGNAVESARANVSLTNIRETVVLVPGIGEQLSWDKVVQNTANLEQAGRRAMQTSEDLFNSLVQRAFKGEFQT